MMLQEIDREKCTGCGSCFKSCGLDVFRLDTDQPSVAPCQWACPTGVDIRGYVYSLQQGKIQDAAEILMAANPLPALTGRTCHRFCEGKCARTKVDDAVNINALEQYVGDWVLGRSPEPGFIRHTGKIGVIGSGAAGMSCAYYLNRKGYEVTVFESEEQPGGLFRTAYPELASGVLDSQIDYLGKLGIVFECGVTVGDGREVTLEQLREKGYKAFLLAVGGAGDKTKRAVPPFSSVANITEDSLISVNPGAYVTSSKDVFAAGNATGGENSVAHAIAGGREAAESIERHINGWHLLEGRRDAKIRLENPPGAGIKSVPRLNRSSLTGREKGDQGFVFEEMLEESQRCMTCGSKAFAAYRDDCMNCYTCEMVCPEGAVMVHPFKENLPRTIPYETEGVR
jgi:NADPH-dependent glutamate synthase beta subunit-like oxidoreductase